MSVSVISSRLSTSDLSAARQFGQSVVTIYPKLAQRSADFPTAIGEVASSFSNLFVGRFGSLDIVAQRSMLEATLADMLASREQLDALRESLSDLSASQALELQAAMNRLAAASAMMSRIIKAANDTKNAIISNIKG